MIRVVRPAEPADVQAALTKPFPRYQNKTEIERAREYYATQPPPTKAYPFERYSEHAVCFALDALFYGKCAYCESVYRAVDARDVEHFRPKGGVSESPGHPGYWWLAANWTNLLPSCPPCNQRRRQLAYDPTKPLAEFEAARQLEPEMTSGKANAFPVSKNNWITDEQGNLAAEDPLLINPCDRDPSNHLEFVFDWKKPQYIWEADPVTPIIRPHQNSGQDDPYALASIAIYGLRRADLFRTQMERVRELQLLCIPIVDLVRDLAQDPPPANAAVLTNRLKQYKTNLTAFAKPDKPYAAIARAFIKQFDAELQRLVEEGV
jgi:hypothetical protein